MKKRILSILLTLVMILGMIPLTTMTAMAVDPDDYVANDGKGHYIGSNFKEYYNEVYWIDNVDFSSENFSDPQWSRPLTNANEYDTAVWSPCAVTNVSVTKYRTSEGFSSLNFGNKLYYIPVIYQGGADTTQDVQLVDYITGEKVDYNDGQYSYDETKLPDGVYMKRYKFSIDHNIDGVEFGINPATTATLDGKALPQSNVDCVPNTYYIYRGGPVHIMGAVYPNAFYRLIYAYGSRMYIGDARPEINSVSVNGESFADGANHTLNSQNVTIKTTYDSVLSDALTDYGCTVKKYGRWYLNGEKLNIAATTPVDNGNGTSSDTYYRTLNDGDELEIETWLEVKWPDGSTDIVDEHTMTIIAKAPKFTTQPQGGTVVYNQRHIANWATNFTPVKQELVRYSPAGSVVQVLEISADASLASLSYMADGYYYRIRSYYDYYSNAYIESDKFYVTTDPYFTPNYEHGNTEGDIIAGITYVPNGDGTFNANVHVDLSYVDGQMLQQAWGGTGYYWYDHNNKLHNASVDVGTSKIYFTLYDVGENLEPGKEWRVKVYLADDYYADWEWRNITFHYVTDTVPELKSEDVVTPAFTTQPVGGEVASGEKLTVNWATNFTPVKSVLMKVIIHPVDGEVVTRENLGTATSAAVGAGYEYCIVRAYYSDSNYVDSDKFYVTEKVSGSGVTVNCIGDIDYTVSGNVVTVDHEVACKVGYLDGTAYKAITAVANGDGTYSFTVPAGVTEVLLVVKGDVSGDGRVNMGDVSKLYAHIKGTNILTGDALFMADISGDGRINMGDVSKLYAHIKGTNLLTWDT